MRIFLNSKGSLGEVDRDIDSFLAYVEGNTPKGKFTRDIAAEVERVKAHKEMKVEYMTYMAQLQDERREGIREGIRKGILEGKDLERVSSIRNVMETLSLTLLQAMNALKIPADDQPKYAAMLQNT